MLTLSSDFGSPYPAAMKGVIRQWTDAELIDVTHDLPRQAVRASAFWIDQLLPYFPPAVHLVVIDPGVGTDRDALIVRSGEHALVGPDNGLLMPVARTLADGAAPEVFDVAVERNGEVRTDTTHPHPHPNLTAWPPDPASSTFHGRDVFAPAAAHVDTVGVEAIAEIEGVTKTTDFEDLTLPDPTLREDGATGTTLAVDGFGNVITNIPGSAIAERFGDHIKANGVWAAARRTYAAVEAGHRVVTVGSHGNVELAVNQGRGDETFGISEGGRIRLSW